MPKYAFSALWQRDDFCNYSVHESCFAGIVIMPILLSQFHLPLLPLPILYIESAKEYAIVVVVRTSPDYYTVQIPPFLTRRRDMLLLSCEANAPQRAARNVSFSNNLCHFHLYTAMIYRNCLTTGILVVLLSVQSWAQGNTSDTTLHNEPPYVGLSPSTSQKPEYTRRHYIGISGNYSLLSGIGTFAQHGFMGNVSYVGELSQHFQYEISPRYSFYNNRLNQWSEGSATDRAGNIIAIWERTNIPTHVVVHSVGLDVVVLYTPFPESFLQWRIGLGATLERQNFRYSTSFFELPNDGTTNGRVTPFTFEEERFYGGGVIKTMLAVPVSERFEAGLQVQTHVGLLLNRRQLSFNSYGSLGGGLFVRYRL
jgi:hypothetical protein